MTISANGLYYLTGNLTVTTGDGIDINAANVTLDLDGFTVASTRPPPVEKPSGASRRLQRPRRAT